MAIALVCYCRLWASSIRTRNFIKESKEAVKLQFANVKAENPIQIQYILKGPQAADMV